jgi:hypothetical protein
MAATATPSLDDLLKSFIVMRGAVRGPGDGVLALCADDMLADKIEHSVIVRLTQGQLSIIGKLKWETRALFLGPQEQVVSIGSRGRAATINPGVSIEVIGDELDKPGLVGLLRDATRVGTDVLYAVALDGRLYRKQAQQAWSLAIPKLPGGPKLQRLAQGAVSEDNLLAASIDGALYRKRDDAWHRVDLPSSAIVNFIWMAGGDRYIACGLRGLLLIGAAGEAKVIQHSFTHEDFWCACAFEDQVYISSLHHLYRLLPDGDLERIDPLGAGTFHLMSVSGDTLWSLGSRDVLELRHGAWKRVL